MPVRQKKGTGIIQLRSSLSANDGTTVNETETWTGPYAELKVKYEAILLSVKSAYLVPSEANHGVLTITREVTLTTPASVPGTVVIEVLWPELRKAVETNPLFKDLTPAEILSVKKAIDNGDPVPSEGEALNKLWEKLAAGTTEWSIGVPVVRRTTTKRAGNAANGRTWFREDPPVEVEGEWEFMKTLDERRKDGASFTQTEEWTGAEIWDHDLYPIDGGDP